MNRRCTRSVPLLVLLLALWSVLPVEALCWGSLFVASRSSRLRTRCPTPSLTRTWRIKCYDGCGYSAGIFEEYLSGFGQCFKGANCTTSIRCLPLAGAEILRFNPPSLSAAIINRAGYYQVPPCTLPACQSVGVNTLTVSCPCDRDADPVSCAENDPIIVSLGDAQVALTDRAGGVRFDLGNTGEPVQVPWTAPGTDDAFLALDRNGNGAIDSGHELFGDATPQHPSEHPNGFLALAMFDDTLSGGNEDGKLSRTDAIFPDLRLWQDVDHDGRSDPGELMTLESAGLESIDLAYGESHRVDRHGNAFRFRAASHWVGGIQRPAWNVFLTAQ